MFSLASGCFPAELKGWQGNPPVIMSTGLGNVSSLTSFISPTIGMLGKFLLNTFWQNWSISTNPIVSIPAH
ncbi:MAG: hypothetical protein R6T85_10055 [Egibacteraceae bacterium]